MRRVNEAVSTGLGRLLIVAVGVTMLAACGDDETTGPEQPTATAYVVHGINGTDIEASEALPVDVFVSGQGCVLEGVEFRDIEGPLTLPADSAFDVRVHLAADEPCAGDVAIEATDAELQQGDNVSITAHLDAQGSPTATVFANDLSAADGSTKVSPRHAAVFGPVDVAVDGSPAFENVPNGASGTAALDPGSYEVAIQTPDNQTTAFSDELQLDAGTLYAVYAVGSVENGTFEVLLQTLSF